MVVKEGRMPSEQSSRIPVLKCQNVMEIEAAAMLMKSGSCYSIDDGGAAEVHADEGGDAASVPMTYKGAAGSVLMMVYEWLRF